MSSQRSIVIGGGAFAGLEKIIADRLQKRSIGFGAHVADPDKRRVGELLQKAEGTHKPVWTLPLVGRTIRTFKEGRHMPGLPGYGRETFAEYVEREVRR